MLMISTSHDPQTGELTTTVELAPMPTVHDIWSDPHEEALDLAPTLKEAKVIEVYSSEMTGHGLVKGSQIWLRTLDDLPTTKTKVNTDDLTVIADGNELNYR